MRGTALITYPNDVLATSLEYAKRESDCTHLETEGYFVATQLPSGVLINPRPTRPV